MIPKIGQHRASRSAGQYLRKFLRSGPGDRTRRDRPDSSLQPPIARPVQRVRYVDLEWQLRGQKRQLPSRRARGYIVAE